MSRRDMERKHLEDFHYDPITREKKALIQRQSMGPKEGGQVVGRLEMELSTQTDRGSPADMEGVMKDVTDSEKTRGEHKDQLQKCNKKLETWLDKNKGLIDENARLVAELRQLREQWGVETAKLRAEYDKELQKKREELEKLDNERAEKGVQLWAIDNEYNTYRLLLDDVIKRGVAARDGCLKMDQRLADMNLEVELIRRRKEMLEKEKAKLTEDNKKLWEDLQNLLQEVPKECLNHVTADYQVHNLEEELEFLKKLWDLERRELEKLASGDLGVNTRDNWKAEISQLYSELSKAFDEQLDEYRHHLKAQFDLKASTLPEGTAPIDVKEAEERRNRLINDCDELKKKLGPKEAEAARLQDELDQKRKELDDLRQKGDKAIADKTARLHDMKDQINQLLEKLRALFDQKVIIEFEITKYRKMLDMEDPQKPKDDLQPKKATVAQAKKPTTRRMTRTKVEEEGEIQVKIGQLAQDYKSLTIVNDEPEDVDLKGWRVEFIVDKGRVKQQYHFPAIVINKGETFTMYPKGLKPKTAGPRDIEMTTVDLASAGPITTLKASLYDEDENQVNYKSLSFKTEEFVVTEPAK